MENPPNARVYDFHERFPNLDEVKAREISLPPSNLIYFDTKKGVSKMMTYSNTNDSPFISRLAETQEDSIVVAVDCAREADSIACVVSFGVWFGADSVYNANGLLPPDLPQTVQAAELYAVKKALNVIRESIHRSAAHGCLSKVFIMTESPYIKDGLSKDIWRWEMKNYKTSRQTIVANADALKAIHELIKEFEGDGVAVLFWKVDKKYNGDASRLAAEAIQANDSEYPKAAKPKKPKKKNRNVLSEVKGDKGKCDDHIGEFIRRSTPRPTYFDDFFTPGIDKRTLWPHYEGLQGVGPGFSHQEYPIASQAAEDGASVRGGLFKGAWTNYACGNGCSSKVCSAEHGSPGEGFSKAASLKDVSKQRSSSGRRVDADFPSFSAASMRAAFESMSPAEEEDAAPGGYVCRSCEEAMRIRSAMTGI